MDLRNRNTTNQPTKMLLQEMLISDCQLAEMFGEEKTRLKQIKVLLMNYFACNNLILFGCLVSTQNDLSRFADFCYSPDYKCGGTCKRCDTSRSEGTAR